MEGSRIGIVGGGQLGRMLTEAAKPMGFEVTVIDPAHNCPAKQAGAEQIHASLNDKDAVQALAENSDVITWEIEHIDAEALENVSANVQPSPNTLRVIQDKLTQKMFLVDHGIPVANFMPIANQGELVTAFEAFGEVIVKTRAGGYDGRGNLVLARPDWGLVIETFGAAAVYAEQIEPFQKELAVVIARDRAGNIAHYPAVETIHEDNICHLVLAPAPVERSVRTTAEEIAHETIGHLEGAGVFGIEMFLTENDEIVVNEIAPRVHNSGHHTIEANSTSQFEQHIRAVTGLPLGSTDMLSPAAMINILGDRNGDVRLSGLESVLAMPDVHLHLYGKTPTKLARKMGHLTVRADSVERAKELAIKARKELSI